VAMEDVVNAAFVSHKLEQPSLYTSSIRNVALISFREDVHRTDGIHDITVMHKLNIQAT